MRNVFSIHGIPIILLRNHVPVSVAQKYFDRYEITPEYVFSWDKKAEKVVVTEKPWTIKDDNGIECYSLFAAPLVISLVKQLADVLK